MTACCCVIAVIVAATCTVWGPKSLRCQRETGFVLPVFPRSEPVPWWGEKLRTEQSYRKSWGHFATFVRHQPDLLPLFASQKESNTPRSCKTRTRVKKRRYEDDSSEDETTTRRSGGMATRYKETPPSSSSRNSGEGAAAKRRRMTTRNQPDLTFCEWVLRSSLSNCSHAKWSREVIFKSKW